MDETNLTIVPVEQLPETDLPKRKKRPKVNCLGEVLRELMDELGLKDAQVVKETGISFSTFFGWITDDVNSQLADGNLFRLWQYINRFKKVHLEYLVYGVGEAEELEED